MYPRRKHRRIVVLAISINNRLIAGSLNAKLIAAIRREDISVSVPTSAIVGCAMDIKIRCRSQVTSLPDSQSIDRTEECRNIEIDACEEFVVSVVGPKGASDNGSIGRLMTGSNHRPCTVVENGKGMYSTVIRPKLPGVHMVAVQHVTHDIIEPAKDVSAIAARVMSENLALQLAARRLLKLEV